MASDSWPLLPCPFSVPEASSAPTPPSANVGPPGPGCILPSGGRGVLATWGQQVACGVWVWPRGQQSSEWIRAVVSGTIKPIFLKLQAAWKSMWSSCHLGCGRAFPGVGGDRAGARQRQTLMNCPQRSGVCLQVVKAKAHPHAELQQLGPEGRACPWPKRHPSSEGRIPAQLAEGEGGRERSEA